MKIFQNAIKSIALLTCFYFHEGHCQVELVDKQPIQLDFKNRGIDAEQQQSMALSPLFYLNGNQIASFLDISSALSTDSIYYHSIVLPSSHKTDLAYGYIYENHLQNKFSPNHTLFLVGNPTKLKSTKISLIWIDRNHDFDFQNEIPDTLIYGATKKPIIIGSNAKSLAIDFKLFPFNEFRQFAAMSDEAIQMSQGNRNYAGTRYSFRETRWNLWYSDFVFEGDTLRLGIKDVNCNGLYNDLGIDKVYLMSANSTEFQGNNAVSLKKETILFWMGNSFSLSVLDGFLGKATIKKIASVKNDASLSVGKKFPRFRYCVAEKPVHKNQIRKIKSQFLIVYVWSAENAVFIQDSALLHKIQRTLPSNFKLLMLNHGGSGKYVYRYNRRYDVNFLQGFCSPKVAKKLKLQSMPQSFVLDEHQKIVKIGMNAHQIQRFIAKNTLSN